MSYVPENGEYPPISMTSFETKVLDKLRLASVGRISAQMLADAEADVAIDFLTRDMVARIETLVWADPDQEQRKTIRIYEKPFFESWKHQFFYERGNAAKRFLSKFWDIPFDYEPERKQHTINVHVPAVLPENTIRVPDGMGRFHYPVQVTQV